MATCDIGCQTEKQNPTRTKSMKEAQIRYRQKLKEQNGKLYTPKNAEYMRRYREKLRKLKQEQTPLKILISSVKIL